MFVGLGAEVGRYDRGDGDKASSIRRLRISGSNST